MARPPRIEFAGAVYHVTSHGEHGAPIFADDADRTTLLAVLAQAMHRFDAQLLAYSFAGDHYQLLLYTRQANLSRLMRHINGVYTQSYNRRHGGEGPLFQGRFKALLVDRERLLLDVCRYVDLSAQRLGLARRGGDWPWHSLGAHTGLTEVPDWLDVLGLFGHVLGREARGAADQRRAAERYAKLLAAEPELDIWPHLRQQIFLGDEAFVRRMLGGRGAPARAAAARPRRAPRPWAQWLRESGSREQALYRAHTEGGLSMTALAGELGLSVSRVSRLIAGHERQLRSPS
ncbi:transposase [Roseateles sp. DAIF2]|uniref:transposase n=1 Tax=Roseateles sp. DAIF2 TaxID=2714952 RepID=UPI0018A24BB3|nr:transposase [Roseateles sp. DAIF2]QPF75528.1 transposase [Roseateles sp. DAIF2]